MKCKQCNKIINKLTNRFYRTYGFGMAYFPKTGEIEHNLAFCSMKCMNNYQDLEKKEIEE